jgi:four helix bundle protein
MAGKVESFRDLNVYKLAFELQQEIFALSKSFPREELYSLTDQIRRASRAVGGNIAEAWHKRRYPAHFVSKLTDADAEQAETQHWLDTARACEYVSTLRHKALLDKCTRIGKMLGKMMSQPESFCGGQRTSKR